MIQTMGESLQCSKISAYFQLLRPFTLLAPFLVSSCIMIASYFSLANTTLTYSNLLLIIPASLCFTLLNGASNVLNQVTDIREDCITKPYRPLPRKLFSKKQAMNISMVLYSSAILLSFCIHELFSIFVFLICLFSVTYSLYPRTKKYLFINQIWVAIPRGFLGILGSWSVFQSPFEPLPMMIAGIATVFLFGGTATKDLFDINGDIAVGTKTLVNSYGMIKTVLISSIFMSGAFLLIIPLVYFHIIDAVYLPLFMLSFCGIYIGWSMLKGHRSQKHENTAAWAGMYFTYILFIALFTLFTWTHTFG